MAGEKVQLKFGTVIRPCTCASAYQDAKYGPGMRVANRAPKNAPVAGRCTVCGSTKAM